MPAKLIWLFGPPRPQRRVEKLVVPVRPGTSWTYVKLDDDDFEGLCRYLALPRPGLLAPEAAARLRYHAHVALTYGFLRPIRRGPHTAPCFEALDVETDVLAAQSASSPTRCPWRTELAWPPEAPRQTAGGRPFILEQVYRFVGLTCFSQIPTAESFFRAIPDLVAARDEAELARAMKTHLGRLTGGQATVERIRHCILEWEGVRRLRVV
jgi:hypothetical protein